MTFSSASKDRLFARSQQTEQSGSSHKYSALGRRSSQVKLRDDKTRLHEPHVSPAPQIPKSSCPAIATSRPARRALPAPVATRPALPAFCRPAQPPDLSSLAQPSRLTPPSRPDLLPATPSIRVPPAKNRKHLIMSMRKKWADPLLSQGPSWRMSGWTVKQDIQPLSPSRRKPRFCRLCEMRRGQASNRLHGVFCPEIMGFSEGIVVLSRLSSQSRIRGNGASDPLTYLTRGLAERRRPRCSRDASFLSSMKQSCQGKHRVKYIQLDQEPPFARTQTRRLGRLGLGFPVQAPSMKTGPLLLHCIDFQASWFRSPYEINFSQSTV